MFDMIEEAMDGNFFDGLDTEGNPIVDSEMASEEN